MNGKLNFKLLADVVRKNNAKMVVIGGFAVNYYKYTRQTADIDFLITKEDFDRVIVFLEKQGYEKDFVQDVFVGIKSADNSLMNIDFMFVEQVTLDKIIMSGQTIDICGQEFIVPSLENLIILKLHSIKYNKEIREYRDLSDIVNLIKINNLDYKNNDFKDLCLKYGTEEIYVKIIGALNG